MDYLKFKVLVVEIKDLVGLSKPLEKLVGVCASGLGKITEPHLIRKNADAKAYEMEVMTQALLESKNKLGCTTEYTNGEIKLVVDKSEPKIEDVEIIEKESLNQITKIKEDIIEETPSNDQELLINDIDSRIYYKHLKKDKNIYNTLSYTVNELESTPDEEVSDDKIDEDWITRFFNTIEDINNVNLQHLWGKILAGEIKKPNSYSLRTLELLKNISSKEAELFSKLGTCAIENNIKTNTFVLSDKEVLAKINISFNDILLLQDLGLLHSASSLSYKIEPKDVDSKVFLLYGNELLVAEQAAKADFSFPVYSFTSIGKELLMLVEENTNSVYRDELIKTMKKANNNHKVFSTTDFNNETYNDNSLIEVVIGKK